jgi:hypothetical protein
MFKTAMRMLLNMRERSTPSHRTFIIAGELEVGHHRFGIPASPKRVQLKTILPGIRCFWRVVAFVDEPAGIAVEPSIRFLQTSTSSLDEEVVYERHPGDVDHAVDEIVSPSQMVDAWRGCLYNKIIA